MNNKKLLFAVLPALSISFLTGCGKKPSHESRQRDPATEIGDIINAWTDKLDSTEIPLAPANAYCDGVIVEDFGNEDIYGEYSDSIKPWSCFLRTEKAEELILAKIPMTEPWKVFAWIPFGGWNECPDTEDMMAVCKYWHDKYNVIPAVISSDELQMYASVPINNREQL